ncbi:hypothetical protein CVU37_03345 [candidate division BRC1 bacterium HGW-BRC1-1]|jgi:hypothetical protein|nr:MAG: hypothetical protein CVU37_03345 [candidate division BRC1 bacterium HGW-BRC1-1]
MEKTSAYRMKRESAGIPPQSEKSAIYPVKRMMCRDKKDGNRHTQRFFDLINPTQNGSKQHNV